MNKNWRKKHKLAIMTSQIWISWLLKYQKIAIKILVYSSVTITGDHDCFACLFLNHLSIDNFLNDASITLKFYPPCLLFLNNILIIIIHQHLIISNIFVLFVFVFKIVPPLPCPLSYNASSSIMLLSFLHILI